MRSTRRLITAAAGSLAVLALLAPASEGATQVRQFHGEFAATPSQPGAGISLQFVFKNARAKGKFTPRQLRLTGLDGLSLLCMNEPGEATASASLTTSISSSFKLAATPRAPSQAKPKANRYSYSFSGVLPGSTNSFSGRVYKVGGRGPPLAIGKLTISKLDFPAPGPTNCSTSGQRDWQAS